MFLFQVKNIQNNGVNYSLTYLNINPCDILFFHFYVRKNSDFALPLYLDVCAFHCGYLRHSFFIFLSVRIAIGFGVNVLHYKCSLSFNNLVSFLSELYDIYVYLLWLPFSVRNHRFGRCLGITRLQYEKYCCCLYL